MNAWFQIFLFLAEYYSRSELQDYKCMCVYQVQGNPDGNPNLEAVINKQLKRQLIDADRLRSAAASSLSVPLRI